MKEIQLTKGYRTIVDDEDFDAISKYKWHASSNGRNCYAVSSVKNGKRITMHRFILGLEDYNGFNLVDHIDRDTLNNQRSNLRLASPSQNQHNSKVSKSNTSGYKGVIKCEGRWIAKIYVNRKVTYSKICDSPRDAAIEYNRMALDIFGEFAKLNVV